MDEPPPLLAKPLTQEINMKVRVIACVALVLGLAVGLPATVAATGLAPAPARMVAAGSVSHPAGPGGCCV